MGVLADDAKVAVTIRSRILKFNENQNPDRDEPFEIVEKTHVLEGEEAVRLLAAFGISQAS